MNNEQWYIINDLIQFTDKARTIVYNHFGKWESESEFDPIITTLSESQKKELDDVLSHNESLVIVRGLVKKQKNKIKTKTRYVVSDDIFYDIIKDLNDRMTSNIINSLVKKGLLDMAYDNEKNDFIFWVKDNENENNLEKPETD